MFCYKKFCFLSSPAMLSALWVHHIKSIFQAILSNKGALSGSVNTTGMNPYKLL